MLIDLNEEVFAISEELAKSFTFERNRYKLTLRAQEFEQRQALLLKKVRDQVEQDPTVRALERRERI